MQPEGLSPGYAVNVYLTPQANANTNVIDFASELDNDTPDFVVYGVQTWNFDFPNTQNVPFQLYGVGIYQNWFNLQLTAYFIPPTTDYYTFTIYDVDDVVYIRLGDGVAFDCCSNATVSSLTYDMVSGGSTLVQSKFLLNEGKAYPIKITYINRYFAPGGSTNAAIFTFGITNSAGEGVGSNVYYLREPQSYCPDSVTSTITGSETNTVTSTVFLTITTGTITYTSTQVFVIVPDESTVENTSVETVTITESCSVPDAETTTITSTESCSAPDAETTTITTTDTVTGTADTCSPQEGYTVTESISYCRESGKQLTVFTSGSVEGTSTYYSCLT